jgi:type II secretory pathway component PulM
MSCIIPRVLPRYKKELNWKGLLLVLCVIYQRFTRTSSYIGNLHCKITESVL